MDNKINWTPPELPAEIPQGDMPGARVKIYEDAVEKANLLFPLLLKWREEFPGKNKKCVISVSGGSGVGKTSIASVLAYYFNDMGIGAYTLSGEIIRDGCQSITMRNACTVFRKAVSFP